MASPKSFVFFTLLSLKLGMIAAAPAPVPLVYPLGNLRTFDNGNFKLQWSRVSQQMTQIQFQITAITTTGSVALAFPYIDALGNNKLDVVVAGVNAAGNGYILDYHLTNSRTLALDPSSDYTLASFSRNLATQETVVEFSRSKSTTGDINDKTFVAGQGINVQFAIVPNDKFDDFLKAPAKFLKQTRRMITFVPKCSNSDNCD